MGTQEKKLRKDIATILTRHSGIDFYYNIENDLVELFKEQRIAELKLISKATVGKSITPENIDNQTWQGGLNFARNNLKRYKLDRIRQIKAGL